MTLARTLALVLALSALNQVGALASAQTYRINAPFVKTGIVGDVQDFLVHPGGTDVLFRADVRHEGAFELHHVPLNGSAAPLPIVGLPAGRAVTQYAFSPDGRWVVYVADKDTRYQPELYAHRVGTPGSVKLSGPLPWGYAVFDFQVASDSTRVVYHARALVDGVLFSLLSVPIDGSSPPVPLSSPGKNVYSSWVVAGPRVVFEQFGNSGGSEISSAPISGAQPPTVLFTGLQQVGGFHLSPDGSRILYTDNIHGGLFLRPIDGSSEALLISTAGQVATGVFSPDGARVVWQEYGQLLSRPVNGGAPVLLSSVAPFNSVRWILVTPDSSRVVFVLRYTPGPSTTDFVYSVPMDGSAPAILLDDAGRSLVDDLTISADSRYFVYKTLSQGTGGGLRSMRIDGSAPALRIDDVDGQTGAIAGVTVALPSFLITPDSRRVVYTWGTSSTTWSAQGLYSVPIDRSATPSVLRTGGASGAFGLDPTGTHVLYTAAEGESTVFELYVTGLTGGPSVKLSARLARGTDGDVYLPGGAPVAFDFPAGDVVYSATRGNQHAQLMRASIGGTSAVTPLVATDVVSKFELSPDRTRVVYMRADGALLSAPASGGGAAVTLDDGPVDDTFEISPDGARVVYTSGGDLCSVTIGGGTPLKLARGSLFQISADSTQVVYTPIVNGILRGVSSVAIDRSVGPRAIDIGLAAGTFELTPDGRGLVYLHVSELSPGSMTLYSAPLDGSAVPLELAATGPVFSSLYILAFSTSDGVHTFSPDGEWVLFRGTSSSHPRRIGLYARRFDGSSGIVQFADAPEQSALGFLGVAPDSTHVLYLSGPSIYSSPIDGSSPPVNLNASVDTGFTGPTVAFSPDGVTVVISAVDGLYSTSIDGSSPAFRISAPDPRVVWANMSCLISPDSNSVVYFAGLELFVAPIDGSRAPVLISPPLLTPIGFGTNLRTIAPDSSTVFYTASRTPGVIELFASDLPATPQQRHSQRR